MSSTCGFFIFVHNTCLNLYISVFQSEIYLLKKKVFQSEIPTDIWIFLEIGVLSSIKRHF